MDKKTQALAWSVLPKEFKEEAKRLSQYYSRHVSALFGMERQRADNFYREFVSLFGIHNLISDAEEEEMLTCVKDQAVKLYDIADRAFAINGDKWYQGYMKAMQDLFGSKCLPDEEPQPAEPKVVTKMKPIESIVSIYLATKAEDKEFRQLLHENGFRWYNGDALTRLSFWLSSSEKTKTYCLYPHKIVTFYGEKSPYTLTFSEFKKQYFGEGINLLQETANCDKHFDNIVKDGFYNERRLNIAAQIRTALIGNQDLADRIMCADEDIRSFAHDAYIIADALLAECEKTKTERE